MPPPALPRGPLLLALLLFSVLTFAAAADGFPPYTNYTVGGAARWVFDYGTGKPAANYTAWAESLDLYVGDFLLFNTNANSTVIQTTNATTYALCSLDQDFGNLTSQLGADLADMTGSSTGPIPAELMLPGDNFFFSHASSGLQCRKGMRFKVMVKEGTGLPPTPPPTNQEALQPRAAAAPPIRQEGGADRAASTDAGVGSSGAGEGCRRGSVEGLRLQLLLGLCSIALLAMT